MRDAPDPEFMALQEALAGRYSLQRELGRGGMGVVYLAREVRLDRPVALKLLPSVYATRPELRERFLREARIAARLSHPHIVPIHAVEDVDDFVFMVMAYIEGQTLEQRVRERGPLPVSQAARILREVAWALAYAHAEGVVHRDIKPANILLEAGSGRALVSDFGIAQVSDPGLAGASEIMGTAEYMSPEQASGEAVDGRSDLYALGVVGYFILSGRLPFEGATAAATLARQLTLAAPPLSSVAPEVPAHVAQAIDRLLAKNPAARFAVGEDVADAMSRALEQRAQIPLELRAFSDKLNEASRSMLLLEAFSMLCLLYAVIFWFLEPDTRPIAILMSVMGLAFAITPAAMLLQMTRGLLRSGYGRDELLRASRIEADERREAIASERPAEPSRLDRLASRVAIGGLTATVGTVGYLWFGPYFPGFDFDKLLPLMAAASSVFVGAGLYSAAKHTLSSRLPGEGWLKFWKGRIGRGLFKLAGIKLEQPLDAGASNRPTELAIGLAADRLFEELPGEMRESLSELPAVLRTLEGHAETMRARIAELGNILSDVEQQRGELTKSKVAERESLADDVRAARNAAELRLAEVVAALESIRLQLLRMHAGAGSVAGMTADLGSARDLSSALQHLVEGKREVGEVLRMPKARTRGDTPVPV
jgi:eukaryotic-like serine/threonine-protein kinase